MSFFKFSFHYKILKHQTLGVAFESRFLAPCMGQNEDPITGSAHAAMALYWAKKDGIEHSLTSGSCMSVSGYMSEACSDGHCLDETMMVAVQHHSTRGSGKVFIAIPSSLARSTDYTPDARVTLSGRAVTVMHGQCILTF